MKFFVYTFREFDEKNCFDELSEKYGFEYDYSPEYPCLENVHYAKGYDAVSFTPCECNAELVEAFHKQGVKYICARSIGFEHIDLEKAKELGMRVSCVKYGPETVADYAIMLMLMGCRKITHIIERSKLQDYTLKGKLGKNLSNCTVGILGTGQIGGTVVKHLQSFGCRILANSLFEEESLKGMCEYVSVEKLLAESDVISMHMPASKENYHLLNKETFDMMKDGVILVNTARGALIDTDALIDSIESGKIGFAALDVLEVEDGLYYADRIGDCIPNRNMAILRAFPNVLLTPHTAFYTDEAVYSMAENTVVPVLDMEAGRDNHLVIV